jgi:hypothetical protein
MGFLKGGGWVIRGLGGAERLKAAVPYLAGRCSAAYPKRKLIVKATF